MSEVGAEEIRGVAWPSNGLTEIPFRLYTDPEQYRLEQERIFKGPAWSYLCLAAEIPNSGDWVATTVGETAIVVTRGDDGEINAFVNRCAHRGNLLCIERRGNAGEIKCIYHGWTYDLAGKLTGVAFERGVKRQGGMPPEFRKDDHDLPRLRVAELAGLVFGTFSRDMPDLESLSRPAGCRRHPPRLKPAGPDPRPQHPGFAQQLEALRREHQGHLSRQHPARLSDDVPHQPAFDARRDSYRR